MDQFFYENLKQIGLNNFDRQNLRNTPCPSNLPNILCQNNYIRPALFYVLGLVQQEGDPILTEEDIIAAYIYATRILLIPESNLNPFVQTSPGKNEGIQIVNYKPVRSIDDFIYPIDNNVLTEIFQSLNPLIPIYSKVQQIEKSCDQVVRDLANCKKNERNLEEQVTNITTLTNQTFTGFQNDILVINNDLDSILVKLQNIMSS